MRKRRKNEEWETNSDAGPNSLKHSEIMMPPSEDEGEEDGATKDAVAERRAIWIGSSKEKQETGEQIRKRITHHRRQVKNSKPTWRGQEG